MDHLFLAFSVDLASQATHMHFDDIGPFVVAVIPHGFEQHGPGHDLACMSRQVFQQCVFTRQQVDLPFTTAHVAAQQVEFQIGDLQAADALFARRAAATGEGVQARGQLDEFERFGQVVIAAGTQAAHTLVQRAQGAENQYRGADAGGAQGGKHAQTVQRARQHAVQDDDVVAVADGSDQAIAAVVGAAHFKAMVLKRCFDFSCGSDVVLDDQYVGHGHFTMDDQGVATGRGCVLRSLLA